MTLKAKRLTGAMVCVCALILALYFVQYRVEPERMCPGTFDVLCDPPDTIIWLGLTQIEPAPGSLLARYHGKTGGVRVIAARQGYEPLFAAFMGLVLPAFLLLSSLLLVRRPKKLG